MVAKLANGSNQSKIGSARRSSPQGLENQRGTASGKLLVFFQIKKAESKTKNKPATRLVRLARWGFIDFINVHVFIRSKEIIMVRKDLHKSIKGAWRWILNQNIFWF